MNVTAEAVSSKVISVKWDHLRGCSHVNDLSASFRVQYTADKAIIAKTTEIVLTGLTPYTNYSIKVAAVNEMGDVGPYSYPVTIQTPEDGINITFFKIICFFLNSSRSSWCYHGVSIPVTSVSVMGSTTDA